MDRREEALLYVGAISVILTAMLVVGAVLLRAYVDAVEADTLSRMVARPACVECE